MSTIPTIHIARDQFHLKWDPGDPGDRDRPEWLDRRVRPPGRSRWADHGGVDRGRPRHAGFRPRRPGQRTDRRRWGEGGRHAPGRPPRVRAGRLGLDGRDPGVRPACRRIPRAGAPDQPGAGDRRTSRVPAGRPRADRAVLRRARRCPADGTSLDDPAGPARRQHGHAAPDGGRHAVPARLPRRGAVLDRRRPRRAGRRRGVRHGDRDAHARPRAADRTAGPPPGRAGVPDRRGHGGRPRRLASATPPTASARTCWVPDAMPCGA